MEQKAKDYIEKKRIIFPVKYSGYGNNNEVAPNDGNPLEYIELTDSSNSEPEASNSDDSDGSNSDSNDSDNDADQTVNICYEMDHYSHWLSNIGYICVLLAQ